MLTVLPVQLISAAINKDALQVSVATGVSENNQAEAKSEHKCMHEMAKEVQQAKMPCCDDNATSHQCEGCSSCGDCSKVSASISILPVNKSIVQFYSSTQQIVSHHLSLNGISSKSLIRPPRTLI